MPLSDNELLDILNSYENILEDQINKTYELDPSKILDITPVDQLAKVRAIKDSLTDGGGGSVTVDFGTKIDSTTMPTGGVGNLGWLSAIWKLITDRLPTLVGGKIPVDVASLSVTVDNANLEISNGVGNPIPISDAGASVTIDNSNLVSIDGKLPASLGAKTEVNSLSVTLASDSDLQLINDNSNPLYIALNSITFTETQLTAPGTTTVRELTKYNNVCWQVTVANINSMVTLRFEGSNDNSNWFNLSNRGADINLYNNLTTSVEKGNCLYRYVRVNFVSELGGTSATINITTRLS